MSESENKTPQICSIKVTFPVDSDEQAVSIKRMFNDILAEIPNAKVEFVLLSLPMGLLERPNARTTNG